MEKKTKNKGGRPKENVEDKVDLLQVEKLAGYGFTDAEIGNVLGVTEQTINNYKKDDAFLLSLKRGKDKADSRVVQSLYKRACGFKYIEKHFEAIKLTSGKTSKAIKVKTVVKHVEPNVTACIYWLNNRRPQDWRRDKENAGAPPDALQPDNIEAMIADAERRAGEGKGTCH